MASLISNAEKAVLTGIMDDLFDTFKRTIVIHKESKKTISSVIDLDAVFGYGDNQPNSSYTYTAVNQAFEAIIRYNKVQGDDGVGGLNVSYVDGLCQIRLKEDGHNYIKSGKVEKITFDNKVFKIVGSYRVKFFLDSVFYVYTLQEAK